ncbi:MAG: D-alanine--D-alanine ligase family protein [Anaerolineales bacterium]
MTDGKRAIGVIFGSRSVEHDVSIVTATQVMKALDPARYDVVPIYITRDGRWYTGDNLTNLRNFDIDDIENLTGTRRTSLSTSTSQPGLITPPLAGWLRNNRFQKLDVMFPVVHGSHGEDGTLQGLFELVDLPYVGTGVMTSAIANDKAMTKTVLAAHGIPVLEKYLAFQRHAWHTNRDALLKRIANEIGYPVFVKPLRLGSSIGIAQAHDAEEAAIHIDIALNLEQRVLVEQTAPGEDVVEINCAVMGNHDLQTSVLEQPVSYEDFLTYEEKYMREGGASGMKGQERIIPAPIDENIAAQIRHTTEAAFRAIGGAGIARFDYFLDKATGRFWVNEINTMPGSLAFYLWEPSGMSPGAVCDELIRLALDTHKEKQQTTFNYKSRLIHHAATRGSKGSKSSKS